MLAYNHSNIEMCIFESIKETAKSVTTCTRVPDALACSVALSWEFQAACHSDLEIT